MFFSRRFTTPGFDLIGDIVYESRVSQVRDASGKVLRESPEFMVPRHWSVTASDMLIGKFARRAGVPGATVKVHEAGVPEWLQASIPFGSSTCGETHASQVFHRLAGCWTYHAWKAGYFRAPKGSADKNGAGAAIHMPYESARAFYDEVCYMLAYQMAAPNSPQWFNCFSGRERFLTSDGPVAFADVAGESVTVWTRHGWKAATVEQFGIQTLRRVTFAPAFWGGGDYRPGWNVGKTNRRVTVEVTADHRWLLADETQTTALAVGDVVPGSAVSESGMTSDYRNGYRHGVVFGDGNLSYRSKAGGADTYRVRLCGAKAEMKWAFDRVGHPSCFGGDPLCQVKSADNLKDYPAEDSTADYVRGFIQGWIDTDGSDRSPGTVRLSSNRGDALEWLERNAAFGGWILGGHSFEEPKDVWFGDRKYRQAGPQHSFVLSRSERAWKVVAIEENVSNEVVFCAVVPAAGEFVLESGIVTGNCGLHWAYGIKGGACGTWRCDPETGEPYECQDTYTNPVASACFIQSVEDSLLGPAGIMDLWEREARVFKMGSGSGCNFSRLRGKGEPLTGGGTSSGLLSWLGVGDRSAGAIKSGGTCLAPYTPLFTDRGVVKVQELAESGKRFACLSYDPPAGRYKAKWARAWRSGRKPVVAVITDKGRFDVSYDHPMRLADGTYIEAGLLTPGKRLFACHVADRDGYLMVSLRTGKRGGGSRYFHRLISEDLLGAGYGDVTDHRDDDKRNNLVENLKVTTQAEHAARHGREAAERGERVFVTHTFPKHGAANPMSASAPFWADAERSAAYRAKQASGTKPRARAMQKLATRQRMMNIAWRLLNAGRDIGTFELYIDARQDLIARVDSIARVRRDIDRLFGSYPQFLRAVDESNHCVVSVETVGEMDVYDVQVACPTIDALVPESGHNFVIWSGDNAVGSGIAVHNTRRAARMVILDDDHPDLPEFISWKVQEEEKVAALVAGSELLQSQVTDLYQRLGRLKACGEVWGHASPIARGSRLPAPLVDLVVRAVTEGLDCPQVARHSYDFEGAAYQTVSGQNANNSIRASDSFMQSVQQDKAWELKGRVCSTVNKTLRASQIFDDICDAAWRCADPGLHFKDAVNDWNTCPADAEIRGSNPCSEFLWHDGSSCNLASLRLTAFMDDYEESVQGVDTDAFRHATRIWTTVLDISVGMAAFPSKETALGAWNHRTLGLGYSDLGALLMRLAVPYGSPEGRAMAGAITALMHFTAWETSAELAADLGSFPRYEANKESVRRVLFNHGCLLAGNQAQYLTQSPPPLKRSLVPSYLLVAADLAYQAAEARMVGCSAEPGGLRNAQLTLLAPCGTIGLVMDCDTTGVEPDFSLVKYKTLAGGGMLKIVNQSVGQALQSLGYKANAVEQLVTHVGETGSLPPGFPAEHRVVFATAGELDWRQHLGMMAAVQPFLSGGISKTVNMPRSATKDEVRALYIQAWEYRLKCVALYRDQSKLSQPLSSHTEIIAESRPKLPTPDRLDTPVGVLPVGLYQSGLHPEGLHPEVVSAIADPKCRIDTRITSRLTAGNPARTPEDAKRLPLPDRRYGYTQKLRVGGQTLYLRTGEYPEGRLGEVFIDLAKQGSTMRSICSCFAISVSLGLQHGVPLEEYVEAYVGCKFEPDGIVGGHDQIKMAASIFDAVFRELAIHYLGRTDLANCPSDLAEQWPPESQEGLQEPRQETNGGEQGSGASGNGIASPARDLASSRATQRNGKHPETSPAETRHPEIRHPEIRHPETQMASKPEMARSMGYSGDSCRECGSFRVSRTGPCQRCENCGASSGCS